MSPERDWMMRVEDILACIQNIEEYTQGLNLRMQPLPRFITSNNRSKVYTGLIWMRISNWTR